ncbi:MAG: hypothetical protein RMJ17_02755 [Candidatus Aenigmarchaeota archaeon]|nr:hypothetical protein [Candidatus Aenigmarchaeota archaeon]MDW8149488.1 hypothetical protein [Candidatus Aenigmarchaeota archaeon]
MFETSLNQMVFQTLYFVLQECNYLKYIMKLDEDKKRKNEIINKINKVVNTTHSLLDRYQLWYFFNDKPLNLSELWIRISNQSNPYYKKFFEIYREFTKILFSRTILTYIVERIEFPIISFEYIYELWAISIICSLLSKRYKFKKISFESYRKRKVKMNIEFDKSSLIYEIKFNPLLDSLYLEKLITDKIHFNIKPDLLIILRDKNVE